LNIRSKRFYFWKEINHAERMLKTAKATTDGVLNTINMINITNNNLENKFSYRQIKQAKELHNLKAERMLKTAKATTDGVLNTINMINITNNNLENKFSYRQIKQAKELHNLKAKGMLKTARATTDRVLNTINVINTTNVIHKYNLKSLFLAKKAINQNRVHN
ncbi:21276_t:CDS:2, partial [Cetraspora pellucida]